ncbi:hypothetical protein RB601_003953 [Gaeumannomyces tritici]
MTGSWRRVCEIGTATQRGPARRSRRRVDASCHHNEEVGDCRQVVKKQYKARCVLPPKTVLFASITTATSSLLPFGSIEPANHHHRLANMHFSAALLSLATTALAIDIRGHANSNCGGGFRACTNINPNVCCVFSTSASSGLLSVSIAAIPTSWRITGEAYTGGGCSFLGGQWDSNGTPDICMPFSSRGDRTGGRYWFRNRKRADDRSCPAEQAGVGKCEAAAKPDTLVLADGTKYSISGLADDKVEEMSKIADSGAGADAMPAEFQVLRRDVKA